MDVRQVAHQRNEVYDQARDWTVCNSISRIANLSSVCTIRSIGLDGKNTGGIE